MAFDPLSRSTRRTRRALLGVASAVVVIHGFNVTLTDTPGFGLKIGSEATFLPYLLLAATFYLLIAFCLSVADDIANLPRSEIFQIFDEDCEKIKQKEISILEQEIRPVIQQKSSGSEQTNEITAAVIDAARYLLPNFYTDKDFKRAIKPIVMERIRASLRSETIIGLTERLNNTRIKIEVESLKKFPQKYLMFRNFRLLGFEAIVPVIFTIAALWFYFASDPGWGSRAIRSDQLKAVVIDTAVDSEVEKSNVPNVVEAN